jgi:hypothetical protein
MANRYLRLFSLFKNKIGPKNKHVQVVLSEVEMEELSLKSGLEEALGGNFVSSGAEKNLKNQEIKKQLEFQVSHAISRLKGEFTLEKVIQRKLDQFDQVYWVPNPEIDMEALKKQAKADLIAMSKNNKLHQEMQDLVDQLVDVRSPEIQKFIEDQFLTNFKRFAELLSEQNNQFTLSLLFIEHDYGPEAYFCGFDDPSYSYELLYGKSYLKYDYEKEILNGDGSFDFKPLLQPCIDFEHRIGEEEYYAINETSDWYVSDIEKLYRLNAYLGIHLCLENIKDKVRDIGIPMHRDVYFFGNEHDCEQYSIYVL